MNKFIAVLFLTSMSSGLQGMDAMSAGLQGMGSVVVKFGDVEPMKGTGCGDVRVLASNKKFSLAHARQEGRGDWHVHDTFTEFYHCTGGKGVVYWSEDEEISIEKGDVVEIPPGQHHGLGVEEEGGFVEVLVACHPIFNLETTRVLQNVASSGRKKVTPPNLHKKKLYDLRGAVEGYPAEVLTYTGGRQAYAQDAARLLYVLGGEGRLVVPRNPQTELETGDSVALEPGAMVTGQNFEFLSIGE